MKRVAAAEFPSGRDEAILEIGLLPVHINRRYGLEFGDEYDDLGLIQVCPVELEGGFTVELWRRPHSALTGTGVRVDFNADLLAVASKFIEEFELTFSDIMWLTPGVLFAPGDRSGPSGTRRQ